MWARVNGSGGSVFKLSNVAGLLLVGCSAPYVGGGYNDTGFSSAPAGPTIVDVAAACNGNVSAFDWLVEVNVAVDKRANGVFCDISQGPNFFGTLALDEVTTRTWYGSYWEDDVGTDCDRTVSIVFDCFAE